MAKWHAPLVFSLFALAVGCQTGPQASMVESLPAPNFSGPALADQFTVPMPRPTPPPAVAVAPSSPKVPRAEAGIPAAWVPIAAPNKWYWIVIHHSATPTGGAAAFDKMHRAKGWDELGYHFVIGNGTDTRDGQVEVGSRWPKQKWGAHAKTPDNRFNEHGIGICLVGNFDVTRPTDAQMKAVVKLVAYLERTYHIPPDHILGHGDTKPTDCPGRNMHVAQVRRLSAQLLADSGEKLDEDSRTALARELLNDVSSEN